MARCLAVLKALAMSMEITASSLRTGFEMAKDVYLLGKIGLHRVGVA